MDRADQLRMIHRHIVDGERCVASQRAVVYRLTGLGADTTFAEDLLEAFEATLAEHRRHLARALRSGEQPHRLMAGLHGS